jgi:16S rRNA (cytosine1402-N4)-methyltransferase
MTNTVHIPVLLEEITSAFAPQAGKTFVDATLGAAGHTLALLESGAKVIGLDRDSEILKIAEARIKDAGFADQFEGVHTSFSRVAEVIKEPVDGILFDLGVSSYQLDTPERGFSFRYDAPLDMRMDKTLGVTAADLVNALGRKELYELFTTLGEEFRCRRLIEEIITARKIKPFTTTGELVAIIDETLPRTGSIHPATKIFQALRMAVNSEREELKAALPSALSSLKSGGILAVISFHSGEDSIVKTFFQDHSGELEALTDKPVIASDIELTKNPRSRSAKLRIGRKS